MSNSSLPDDQPIDLSAIEVVLQGVADEIIADALATIRELEHELDGLQSSVPGERLDGTAQLLIEHADDLVRDAQAHGARITDEARATAAAMINAKLAPKNGQG